MHHIYIYFFNLVWFNDIHEWECNSAPTKEGVSKQVEYLCFLLGHTLIIHQHLFTSNEFFITRFNKTVKTLNFNSIFYPTIS